MKPGWNQVSLSEIATITMGQSPPSEFYNTTGVGLPFFQGCKEFGEFHPVVEKFCSELKRIAQRGDVLMSVRAPVGTLNIADRRCCIGRWLSAIKGREGGRFIYYLLKANLELIQSFGTGTTYQAVNKGDVAGLLFNIPPLPIQRKIASILSAYDDLIENNLRRIKILEEMAQALYREWFVKFRFPEHEKVRMVDSPLGKIPEGWEVKTVGDTFDILGGGTPSKKISEYWDGGTVNWYTPSDLTSSASFFMDQSGTQITQIGLQKSSARMFPAFSVMMTSRATLGVISINTTGACTNQGFITCIPNERFPLYALCYWLKENVKQFISLGTGATFKEITKGVFKTLGLVVPAIKITARFEETVRPLGNQILNLQRKNRVFRQTRDLLLPKLISGELDVSDLNIPVPEEAT